MRNQRTISFLTALISIMSFIATVYAILSSHGQDRYDYKSIFGENVAIYGKGLYQHDSVSIALQAIAQDYVTLFIGIPLLNISLYLTR